ncbi:MAG: hypothetical protein AB1449_09270 [Chloroflexota bacterium]
MPLVERDRERRRRQRRRWKLRELKDKLAQTTDSKTRKRLIARIQKLDPRAELPPK